jgi:hypothetical protein
LNKVLDARVRHVLEGQEARRKFEHGLKESVGGTPPFLLKMAN